MERIPQTNEHSTAEHEAEIAASYNAAAEFDSKEKMHTTLTGDQERVYQEALDRIQDNAVDGSSEGLSIKRDWADSAREHQEKQQAHIAKVANNLSTILARNERKKEIDAHNKELKQHQGQVASREAQREKLANQKRWQHGEGYVSLFSDEIEAEIEEALPERPVAPGGEVDISAQKAESLARIKAQNEHQEGLSEGLKNFYKSFNKDAKDQVIVPPAPPELTDEVRAQLPPVPEIAGSGKSDRQDSWGGWAADQEGLNVSAADHQPIPLPSAEQADDEFEDIDDLSEAETKEKEAIDPTPQGIRARMKAKLEDMRQKLNNLYYGAGAKFTTEYGGLQNQAAEEEYRNRILGGAIGVMAVGAAALAVHKGMSFDNPLDMLPTPDSMPDISDLPDVNGGDAPETGTTPLDTPEDAGKDPSGGAGTETDNVDKNAHKQEIAKRTLTLAEGDNIWGQSEEMLKQYGIEATNENIDIVKDAVLDKYSITEEEARSLPVGVQYTVPQEVIEELLKKQ